jgi:pimeloyl-ACP methyl ester carboxylesterase
VVQQYNQYVQGLSLRRAVLAAAVLASGCLHQVAAPPSPPVQFDRPLTLNDHRLTIHMSRPRTPGRLPLLVYATGDGGWRGKDLDVFRQLVLWNYPVAGFSAPDYLGHMGSKTTTPASLARDYEAIISFVKASVALAEDRPVVLVGISRGADLAVIAAGRRVLRHELWGVVAVGLTEEEEYVRWFRLIGGRVAAPRGTAVMVELYDYLPLLGPVPISVIQSTHDKYLPAAEARRLFGSDTDRRRLQAIEARDHSFGHARSALYATIHDSLTWVAQLHSAKAIP